MLSFYEIDAARPSGATDHRGIILSVSPDLLVKCVRKVAAGETWIDNQSVNPLVEACRFQTTARDGGRTQARLHRKSWPSSAASRRANVTMRLLISLVTTEPVINNFLRVLYSKLGVSDRLELPSVVCAIDCRRGSDLDP